MAKPFCRYKKAFNVSLTRVPVSSEIFSTLIRYTEDDDFREWNAKALGSGENFYIDGEYYWSDKIIEKVKKGEYGFADGFVEHVLERVNVFGARSIRNKSEGHNEE